MYLSFSQQTTTVCLLLHLVSISYPGCNQSFPSFYTFGPDKCCFQFIKERLPKTKVLSFEYTDKRCAMEGVLLRMLKGKQICADPTMQWVKRIMKVVGTRNDTSSVFKNLGQL
uniref:C-C motif chemokine n=1 Tax=Amphilophus citrinellus TaxID=61819 RepID=A0A3Q0S4U6_AMPCI